MGVSRDPLWSQMMVFCYISVITILFLTNVSICASQTTQSENQDSKPILVHMIMRHGDRAPVKPYPTDPNTEDSWPNGYGNLTRLGERQLYAHGYKMRNFYQDLDIISSNEVLVNSSAVERCRLSAKYFMSTFLQQPILVYSNPLYTDKYLSPYFMCPVGVVEEAKHQASPENIKKVSKHKDLFLYCSEHSGMPVNDMTALLLADCLLCEKIHKLIIPDWVPPIYKELMNYANRNLFSDLKSPLLQKLHAGPLLEEIASDMTRKASGDLPDLKFRLFSGHDYNIAVVQQALHIYDRRPPYVASLCMELHDRGGEMSVRFLYFNSTHLLTDSQQKPHVLILPGCSEFCPLEEFQKRVKKIAPKNYVTECAIGVDVGKVSALLL